MNETENLRDDDTVPPFEEDSIRDSFARLIDAGREMADAEVGWAKLRAKLAAVALRNAVALGSLALLLLIIAVLLLFAAAVIALIPHVGLLGATLIVAGVSVVVALLLGLAAKKAASGMFDTERG